MRIVAGAWRGRKLIAPPGQGTRPTADRVRQALFDMLTHAPWGGRAVIEGATVLDAFAGTGALGLEALSRGSATACFIEHDAAALRALRANVAACGVERLVQVVEGDVLSVFRGRRTDRAKGAESENPCHGPACPGLRSRERVGTGGPQPARYDGSCGITARFSLVFLDAPYGRNLVSRALNHLSETHCIAPDALIVAEVGRDEKLLPDYKLLAERQHGAARLLIMRIN